MNNLNVNLLRIPTKYLMKHRFGGELFYECWPDVRITYHFATIQYQLYHGNVCYGDVQSGLEE